MDTSRITTPISDRLPSSAATIASSLADATTGLAGQISEHAGQLAEHVGDIDVSRSVRQGRRFAARYVPGVSAPGGRMSARHVLIVVVAIAAVATVFAALRRRSQHEATPPPRDDWSTPSPNGTSQGGSTAERETATTPV